MKIHKLKSIQVLSNGSTNFSYKTFNNLKISTFFEKDYVNFLFNLKNLNTNDNIDKQSSNYKHKYLIKK